MFEADCKQCVIKILEFPTSIGGKFEIAKYKQSICENKVHQFVYNLIYVSFKVHQWLIVF